MNTRVGGSVTLTMYADAAVPNFGFVRRFKSARRGLSSENYPLVERAFLPVFLMFGIN